MNKVSSSRTPEFLGISLLIVLLHGVVTEIGKSLFSQTT